MERSVQCAHAPQAAPAARRAAGGRQRRLAVRAARTIELAGGAVVVAPEGRQKPKGLVHFLGGAFAGAVPHLTYSLLLHRLADGGYTCVCTPYPVTFRHIDCAHAVHAAFLSAVQQLRGGAAGSGGAWAAPEDLPVHGVGHSNGSLLHLLIGSVCLGPGTDTGYAPGSGPGPGSAGLAASPVAAAASSASPPLPPPSSNVLISYNNLQVADAVPLPLGLLSPALQQLRGQGRLQGAVQDGLAQAAATAQQLLAASGGVAAAAAGPGGAAAWQQQQAELLSGLQQWDPALVQLGSVFDEVGDGYQDFTPAPQEARRLIASSYAVPSTLLVRFTDDSIDQTPDAASMLSSKSGGQSAPGGVSGGGSGAAWGNGSSSGNGSSGFASANGSSSSSNNGSGSGSTSSGRAVSTLVLAGSHVTPCGGDPGWWRVPADAAFGPLDALGMAAKAVLQADTQRLADRVLDHLDAHS